MLADLRFAGLDTFPQVVYGFAGRHSSLAEIQALCPNIIMSKQVHGTDIYDVTEPLNGLIVLDGFDGFTTQQRGAALVVKIADCAPILFYDPVTQVIAAAHAGRQGTEQGMAGKMVKHLAERYSVRPADLLACIGPAICVNCYQIDRETDQHYDLWAENKKQLLSAGVRNVELSGLCPACNAHDSFYSYRRDKTAQRNFAFLCLKPV